MLARARWSDAVFAVVMTAPDGWCQMKCFLLLISLKPCFSHSFLISDAFILAGHVDVLTVALGMQAQTTLIGLVIVLGHRIGEPSKERCCERS